MAQELEAPRDEPHGTESAGEEPGGAEEAPETSNGAVRESEKRSWWRVFFGL